MCVDDIHYYYYHHPPGAKLIRQPIVERHVGHHGDGQTAPETTATLDITVVVCLRMYKHTYMCVSCL